MEYECKEKTNFLLVYNNHLRLRECLSEISLIMVAYLSFLNLDHQGLQSQKQEDTNAKKQCQFTDKHLTDLKDLAVLTLIEWNQQGIAGEGTSIMKGYESETSFFCKSNFKVN